MATVDKMVMSTCLQVGVVIFGEIYKIVGRVRRTIDVSFCSLLPKIEPPALAL